MFTSRAEYRLRLRQDNADLRLTPKGRELGLVTDERWRAFSTRKEALCAGAARLAETTVTPDSDLAGAVRQATGEDVAKPVSVRELLKRPGVDADALAPALESGGVGVPAEVLAQLAIDAKYEGYLTRQDDEIAQVKENEGMPLAPGFDYDAISGLSNELKEKLRARRPVNLAEAARVPGVTPAALSLLLVYAKRARDEALHD